MNAREMFEELVYEEQFKGSDTNIPIREILDNREVMD